MTSRLRAWPTVALVFMAACMQDGASPPASQSSGSGGGASGGAGAASAPASPVALRGTADDDCLAGGPGADTLTGGQGADLLRGGAGADVLIGDGEGEAVTPGLQTGNGPFLVVDQFGYRPDMTKVAVLRDPRSGFDAEDSFSPASRYDVVDVASGCTVMTLVPSEWNAGAVDAGSGDAAWWLDFSALTTPGTYRIADAAGSLQSPAFAIDEDVYDAVLDAALKALFYQRAGFAKSAPFAAEGFSDGASHVGPGQDRGARLYNDANDPALARDLSGGWYDAGDYNKYTSWTADYVISLLTSYADRPPAFDDDIGIPESGNGIPDILDEALWGLDWLIRMQNADGSVLSILDVAEASPPSAATGPSRYGPESTSATLTTAGAFALAATVLGAAEQITLSSRADDFRDRAEAAWDWAQANPDVVFRNNVAENGSEGIGYGQQEVDATGRAEKRLSAAIYLAEATGRQRYHDHVAANHAASTLVGSYFVDAFRAVPQRDLLRYAGLPGADPAVANTIRSRYDNAMETAAHWLGIDGASDPFRAPLSVHTWGSNGFKARQAMLFLQQTDRGIGERTVAEARDAAAGYLHYLHGTNPLGLVYLSNMGTYGAEASVETFYHTWFTDGSPLWDSVGMSTHGPAPGFLVGGPNPQYDWDACCPAGCGSSSANDRCSSAPPSPPAGQPTLKSYLQFNDGWPLNSWEITENSNSYQVAYIRLLSRFVD